MVAAPARVCVQLSRRDWLKAPSASRAAAILVTKALRMFRIDPRTIGVEEARRREALAREIAEGWRDWEEFKSRIHALQLDYKWDGQPRDDRGSTASGRSRSPYASPVT